MRDGRAGRLRASVSAWEDMTGRALVVFAGSDQGLTSKHVDIRDVDVVRRLLRAVEPAEVDLLVAGPGGNVAAAARIAGLVRRSARHLRVLLPGRARSAITLLALPADEIVFGCGGELGPLDAVMLSAVPGAVGGDGSLPPTISSRDLANFPRMAADWFAIPSDDARACLDQLCARVFPVNLSQLHRAEHHVRWAARNLVPADGSRTAEQQQALVERLVTGYESHEAVIDSSEAAAVGLPAREASQEEEALLYDIWDVIEAEFAAAAPVSSPGAVTAIAATRHEIARYALSVSLTHDSAEHLVVRWGTEGWADR